MPGENYGATLVFLTPERFLLLESRIPAGLHERFQTLFL